jgi:DNA-binding NarL/FixJ family response regulator
MVEGKTNDELATEQGYSVSTIRHEVMCIYQVLTASDHNETAKNAYLLEIM